MRGFILFQRVLVFYEMQSNASKIFAQSAWVGAAEYTDCFSEKG